MRQLDKGDDKVAKICDALRRETLEPAQRKAESLLAEAEKERIAILRKAEAEAKQLIAKAQAQVEHEQALCQTSLHQAGKQAVELLKQQIERTLFQPALAKWVDEGTTDPSAAAKLIDAIVTALGREGISTDVTAVVAKTMSPEQVNRQLTKDVLERLEGKTVTLGDIKGGVKIKVQAKKMTLDISSEALQELLAAFLRDNFRKYIFGS